MINTPYPHLFSPLNIGNRILPNRLCLPATVTNFAEKNLITERWSNFLVERARGGAAMVVSEIIAVDPEAVAQATTVIGFDDRNNNGFRTTSETIEAAGGTMIAQLWHPGRQQLWHPTKAPTGVSDDPDPYSWTVAHVMDDGDIQNLIDNFIAVAKRLDHCGLAGIELHGAHGYLINQFLSPWSNLRNDDWGADLAGRTRFVRQITAGIRAACQPGFIIGLKMPGTESVEGGIDPDEAAQITSLLATDGIIDYFAYGQGNFSLSLENHVPDMYFKPGHFLEIHKKMRLAAGGIPVMALGRIGTPEDAEKALAKHCCDLIGMSRAHISDAAFGNKAKNGAAKSIRPCVFDNSSWGEIHQGKPLAEFHNPILGCQGEADWLPERATVVKKIAIIGAGPAGLEAAWTAAARGHHVDLYSASKYVGGALRLESTLPGRGDMAQIYEHQLQQAECYGVTFHLDQSIGITDLAKLSVDTIILATGAYPRPPEDLVLEDGTLLSGRNYIKGLGRSSITRYKKAILIDQDQTAATYGLADQLATDFNELFIVTTRPNFAQSVNYCSSIGVYRRLYRAGVSLIPAVKPVHMAAGTVTLENVYGGGSSTIDSVDAVIYVTPRRIVDELNTTVAAEVGVEILHIGDCRSPRNLMAAIHSGHHAAMLV
jgi:2,4-dienoyl-CoA reductase-like NADH-dependent reductase (Old Yellow Enzyme family)/thioredoxin reductase